MNTPVIDFDAEIAMAQARKEGDLWLVADLPEWAWRGTSPVIHQSSGYRIRLRVLKYLTVFLESESPKVGEATLWGFDRA